MSQKTFSKKEIMEISIECCDFLENNQEKEFFDKLEFILIQKIPFGKLQPLGEYFGKKGLKKPDYILIFLINFLKWIWTMVTVRESIILQG